MEPYLKEHQYDYKETTGKVIQMADRRGKIEPSGEGESLRGKPLSKMGDKIFHSKPTDKLKNAFRPAQTQIQELHPKLLYQPKTNETRNLYEQLLSLVQAYIGDCPEEILKDALDQILATLKTEQVLDSDKKIEIEAILGKITTEVYSKLLMMSKQLVDYSVNKREASNEVVEMAVDLDKQEDENIIEDDEQEEQEAMGFDAKEIDEEWLIRILRPMFGEKAEEKEAQIMEILSLEDLRRCESRLAMALGFQNFDLITTLISHKFQVYNLIKFYKAKTIEEKQALVKELSQSEEGHKLVETLVPESEFLPCVPKRTLNLSSLEFEQGAFTLTNSKLILPPGYTRTAKPGYEEIIIPPNDSKKPTNILTHSSLPDFCKPAFQVKALNSIQSAVFPKAFTSDDNLLICAPTGAGKTNIALITILRLLNKNLKPNGNIDTSHLKIVYIAPMKALVSEICGALSFRLQSYGVLVKELTGDSSISRSEIRQTQVIVSTPEKWDIITRKSGDRTFTDDLKLLIIDEVHLLHDLRGPVIESIVARTHKLNLSRTQKIRIIGLSATLPNYSDVANFLQVPEESMFFFDKTYRPVPLQQRYIGITESKAIKRFLLMNEICYEKLLEQAGKNQVLIFVHSRKETLKTARALRDLAIQKGELQKFLKDESSSKELLMRSSESIESKDVKELITSGFCVHHAGLSKDDRKLIEDLFVDKHIQVLVSTATLAWGVNMPAHTVIIKGTQVYSPEKGTWIEISPQDLLQMIGRAGRMDYDSEGEGIIITAANKLQYYLSLLNQQLPIESQLISQLADHLNAEIVLGNIGTMSDALEWIKLMYYPIRVEKNPQSYGFTGYASLDNFLVDVLHSAGVYLDRHGLVKYDKKLGIFNTTALGRVASTYYIKPESISTYNEQLKSNMGPIDVLKVFGLSFEFKYIPVREEEKQEIAKLMEKVPYPVKGSMEEPNSKMNVLLQCYISKLKLDGYTLMADMVYVSQSAARIMRALFEICIQRGWSNLALTSLSLYKMIIHRMWGVMSPLRQFNRLPDDLLLKLEKKEGLTWDLYYDLTVPQITELLKAQNKANQVYSLIRNFPKLLLNAYVQPITRTCIRIELAINKDFEWDPSIHAASQIFWVFVEDVDSELILHYEQFVMKQKHCEQEHLILFTVPLFEPLPPQYFIRVVSDKWISCEMLLPVSFRHLILPEKPMAYSEIQDVIVKVASLKWPLAETIIGKEYLSLLQSQVFSTAFESDESFVFAAPDSTFEVAVLVILNALEKNNGKIVYVVQYQETAELISARLASLENIGEPAKTLTGNLNGDLKILGENRIIITCADYFENLTRRWMQRKALHMISVVIADQLHLLAESGSNLEVCLVRMRYAAAQLHKNIRFVGLCCSVTNAFDIGEWLGAKAVFSYSPSQRSTPISIIIESFEYNYRAARLLAMSKPVYTGIKSYAPTSQVLIFVPDRKAGKTLALDLILYSTADKFRFTSPEIPIKTNEKLISHLHSYGIGLLNDSNNADLISEFNQNHIQILICTSKSSWSLDLSCKLVIVLDMCRYSGKDHRYQDYTIPETLQMLSFATNPGAHAILLCHFSRKEFLKKFLYESYPVESHLDHFIEDHFNSEIKNKTISNKQDAVDWVTWTFMYRRLTQNPNYYNLQGVSGAHINDHLSELVETAIESLEKSKCVEVNDLDLEPTNLSLIADHYSLKVATVDVFSNSLTQSSKIKTLLEILISSVELETFIIRPGEEKILKEINSCLPEPIEKSYLNTPPTKCLLLLHSHFSRIPLTSELTNDTITLIKQAPGLLAALVDISANNGWLLPAFYAITLSQMITQALWETDSPLLQLPHLSVEMIEECKEHGVNDIVDLMNLDDEIRDKILRLSSEKMGDVARACNAFPSVNVELDGLVEAVFGDVVRVEVNLMREGEYSDVHSSYYPFKREEQWWVIIGQSSSNRLFGIKKVKIVDQAKVVVEFLAPEIGKHECSVYLMCDSYLGTDQEEKMTLTIYA